MKIITCEQGSAEWLAERVGCITASEFKRARARLTKKWGNKAAGEPTDDCLAYAHEVALGRVVGRPFAEKYVTWAMKRGQVMEPRARLLYEQLTGNVVVESGIFKTDDDVFGASLDGLVGTDGTVEIKAPVSPAQCYAVWHDMDLSEYIDQIQGGLWITGRAWCDFILYTPQLAEVGKEIFYKRVFRDDDYIDGADEGDPGLVGDLLWFSRKVDSIEAFWRASPGEALQAANDMAAQAAA